MSDDTANKIFDILCDFVGANERDRDYFVRYFTATDFPDQPREFRCCWALGFGGKFHRTPREWWVSMYNEDETEPRMRMMKMATDLLLNLRDATLETGGAV